MAVTCRLATASDCGALAGLMHATDLHYWGDDAPPRAAFDAHVRDRVLAEPGCQVAVAERDRAVVGYACFALLYPAPDLGGALFMKELFVAQPARSDGIGAALMAFIAHEALRRGCVRLDWSTEAGNAGALRFYDRIGGTRMETKVYYRVGGAALSDLAARCGRPDSAGDAPAPRR
ncbi:MAG: GNAT family N-acetyltransferase [Alphaproteobacteria bacterium]